MTKSRKLLDRINEQYSNDYAFSKAGGRGNDQGNIKDNYYDWELEARNRGYTISTDTGSPMTIAIARDKEGKKRGKFSKTPDGGSLR